MERRAKRFWILLSALVFLAATASSVMGADSGIDEILNREIESLDSSKLESFMESLDRETREMFPEFSPGEFVRGRGIDWGGLWQGLVRRLFREIVLNTRMIAQMVALAVLCVVLRNIQFGENGPGELAFGICFMALLLLGVHGFGIAQEAARSAVDGMSGFIYALLPMLVTLLASVGGIGSATMVHPLMVAAIGTTCRLISHVVLPLAFFSAVVGAVGQLSDKYPLSKMAAFLRTVTIGVLGLGLCVFMGVVTVRGLSAAVADGLTIRTAKYVSGSFVPVVGKFFSDAMELITGCSLLLKNSLGAFGAAGLLVIGAFPALKILVLSLIYRLVGALLQPLGEARLADAVTSIGMALQLVFAAVAVAGVMFFIGVTVLVGLGNLTVMVR